MKCRLCKDHKAVGTTWRFNTHALSEVFAAIDGEHGDWFIKEIDVFVEAKNEWVHLPKAFKNKDVITDNYNTHFFEPETEEDKKRGYTL